MNGDPPTRSVGLKNADLSRSRRSPSRFQRMLLKAFRSVWLAFATFPEKTVEDIDILLERETRRDLVRSLKGEGRLAKRQRQAVVALSIWAAVILWAALSIAALSVSEALSEKFQAGYALAFYSFVTSLFLPTPYELALEGAAENIGVLAAVLISSASKATGVFVVVTFGQSASSVLAAVLRRYETAAKVFAFLQEQARRPWGLVVPIIMFAIPFNSDTAILYVLAPLGFQRSWMTLVAFGAFCLRGTLVLLVIG